MNRFFIILIFFFLVLFGAWSLVIHFIIPRFDVEIENSTDGIHPDQLEPNYWNFRGKKNILLGGSIEDNLFQINHLQQHLDSLVLAGGNYVRNTLSSRDPGDVWAFKRLENGLFDLNQWNEDYWQRLEHFLMATSQRNIVVQVELWATFDFYRNEWLKNPYNPVNNINYDSVISRLPSQIPFHPIYARNPFFRSVPDADCNLKLLEFQQKFIDKVLAHTLLYNHVLYCIDNETSVTASWGRFWSLYLKKKASEAGKTIYTTEMWDPHDLNHLIHRETFDHPEVYDFVEISQNNHQQGDKHWENGLFQLNRIAKSEVLRPANNVKVYGNDGGAHKNSQHGIECFVRNVLLGSASTRFHRPPSGHGLSSTAFHVIKSMRSYVEKCDFYQAQPMNELLTNREYNEAYCRAIKGKEYAVYFTNGGEVLLDTRELYGRAYLHWLNITTSEWSDPQEIRTKDSFIIKCPGEKGHWLALIKQTAD